jgi:ubiquinone/menaquinone biosynthesis C-methylase UbiE
MNASPMSKREFFDRHAVSWDNKSNEDIASRIEDLVDRFDIEEGKNILDVGCGTGVLLPHLLKKVKEKGSVFALDFSWKMLLKARKNKAKKGIHFINGSLEALPLKDQTIDYVTCLDTFAHVTDQQQALCEMSRALKKGGKLFIAHTLGKKELAEFHRLAGAEVEHDTIPEDDKMREMMRDAGLKDIEFVDQPNLYLASAKK